MVSLKELVMKCKQQCDKFISIFDVGAKSVK